MIHELAFCFDDLKVERSAVESALGFSGEVPEPFNLYLDEAWAFSQNLPDIQAVYTLVKGIETDMKSPVLNAGGQEFLVGFLIKKEIRQSENVAFFICTAGKQISDRSKSLMQGENPPLGYVYDVLGSFIAEAVGDKMQEILLKEVSLSGHKITNRYSPGYCQWPVSDQPKLFSLFQEKTCGVSLTPSALMTPIKSISGLIGTGRDVRFRDYKCELCGMSSCTYRTLSAK